MSSVSVDAQAMSLAIPTIVDLARILDAGAHQLAGVQVPAGVPGPLAARATHTISATRRELAGAAHSLDGLPDALSRRVLAAGQAQAPWTRAAPWTIRLFKLYAGSFSAETLKPSMAMGRAARAVLLDGRRDFAGAGVRGRLTVLRVGATAVKAGSPGGRVPSGLARTAKSFSKALNVAGLAVTAYNNFTNPNLSTEQKITRTAASAATGAGVSALAGAATGAALGSAACPAVGTLVGFVAGAAWTLADQKLGISNAIGDAAADVADKAGDVVGDVTDTAGDVVDDITGIL